MQNVQCKMQNAEAGLPIRVLHLSFCILHFAFSSPCSLCLCGCFFLAISETSAAPQEVLLVEGDSYDGKLVSVSVDGMVVFRRGTPDGTVAKATSPSVEQVKLDDVVRWGNPVGVRGGRTMVVLADGGRLVTAADWAGGAAVRLVGGKFVVMSELFGEVTLAREAVRGVVFAPLKHAEEREELVERIRADNQNERAGLFGARRGESSSIPNGATGEPSSRDALFLSNGDRVTGELVALERGSLTIKMEGGEAKVPLSRVDAVRVGSRQLSVVSRQLRYAVGLRDGSLVYASGVVAGEKELKLKIGEGGTLVGGNAGDVVFVQALGGRVVYLSDLEPAEYRHVPYLEVGWPLATDRNVLGGPLVVGRKRYLKGLGMHSAGRVSYRLDGKYQRFEAAVAIDDAAEGRGSVAFGVYVLRDGKLNEAYKSGIVRGGEAPQRANVDVAGAQGITLVVDYAERGDEMDRADWLDARLTKK